MFILDKDFVLIKPIANGSLILYVEAISDHGYSDKIILVLYPANTGYVFLDSAFFELIDRFSFFHFEGIILYRYEVHGHAPYLDGLVVVLPENVVPEQEGVPGDCVAVGMFILVFALVFFPRMDVKTVADAPA